MSRVDPGLKDLFTNLLSEIESNILDKGQLFKSATPSSITLHYLPGYLQKFSTLDYRHLSSDEEHHLKKTIQSFIDELQCCPFNKKIYQGQLCQRICGLLVEFGKAGVFLPDMDNSLLWLEMSNNDMGKFTKRGKRNKRTRDVDGAVTIYTANVSTLTKTESWNSIFEAQDILPHDCSESVESINKYLIAWKKEKGRNWEKSSRAPAMQFLEVYVQQRLGFQPVISQNKNTTSSNSTHTLFRSPPPGDRKEPAPTFIQKSNISLTSHR